MTAQTNTLTTVVPEITLKINLQMLGFFTKDFIADNPEASPRDALDALIDSALAQANAAYNQVALMKALDPEYVYEDSASAEFKQEDGEIVRLSVLDLKLDLVPELNVEPYREETTDTTGVANTAA